MQSQGSHVYVFTVVVVLPSFETDVFSVVHTHDSVVPEVDGDVLVGSSVGQYIVGGYVHDNIVVSVAHVTSGHGVVTSAGPVISGHCVPSPVGFVVSVVAFVMNVLPSVGLFVSEVNVVSSVGHVHGNIVGSVAHVTSGHVTSVGLVTSGH